AARAFARLDVDAAADLRVRGADRGAHRDRVAGAGVDIECTEAILDGDPAAAVRERAAERLFEAVLRARGGDGEQRDRDGDRELSGFHEFPPSARPGACA